MAVGFCDCALEICWSMAICTLYADNRTSHSNQEGEVSFQARCEMMYRAQSSKIWWATLQVRPSCSSVCAESAGLESYDAIVPYTLKIYMRLKLECNKSMKVIVQYLKLISQYTLYNSVS